MVRLVIISPCLERWSYHDLSKATSNMRDLKILHVRKSFAKITVRSSFQTQGSYPIVSIWYANDKIRYELQNILKYDSERFIISKQHIMWLVFDQFSLRQLVLGNIRSASIRSQNTLCYFSILIHVNGDELLLKGHQGVQAKETSSNVSLPVALVSWSS